MTHLPQSALILTAVLATGCGTPKLSHDQTVSPHLAMVSADGERGSVIQTCLSAWQNQPFGPNKTTADRTFKPGVTVFGQGYAVDDEETTPQPSLTLIPAAINILGDVNYNLLNANGWYCLVAAVNIGGRMRIYLKDGAHLANDKVDVVVGGRSDAPGGVNVGIGANTDVIIVK